MMERERSNQLCPYTISHTPPCPHPQPPPPPPPRLLTYRPRALLRGSPSITLCFIPITTLTTLSTATPCLNEGKLRLYKMSIGSVQALTSCLSGRVSSEVGFVSVRESRSPPSTALNCDIINSIVQILKLSSIKHQDLTRSVNFFKY